MRKLPALLLPAGLLTVALLSAPPAPPLRVAGRPLLPRPALLKAVFKAQSSLVADYFWVLMLNRIGTAIQPEEYRDVYDYADLVTDLDPRFSKAYLFGGITLPIHLMSGGYANTKESTQLLRKGVARLPEDSRLRFQLAYNLMFFEQQHKEAAVIIEQLSREPGAPDWYAPLATRLYAQSGDFDTGMALTVALRDSAEDEATRAYYDRRVKEILQERLLRKMDVAVARYRSRAGKLPPTLPALVAAGDLSELPEDPLGGRLYLAEDGRVYSTAARFRLEVLQDERTDTGERLIPKPYVTSHD